jgi:hypothetical protein
MAKCAGCKHNYYSAPGGQRGYPGCAPIVLEPHSRCLHLEAYIPMVIEKQKGSDGTSSTVWVSSAIPPDCPTYPQGELRQAWPRADVRS